MLIIMVVLLKKYYGALHNGQSKTVFLALLFFKMRWLEQWQIVK